MFDNENLPNTNNYIFQLEKIQEHPLYAKQQLQKTLDKQKAQDLLDEIMSNIFAEKTTDYKLEIQKNLNEILQKYGWCITENKINDFEISEFIAFSKLDL